MPIFIKFNVRRYDGKSIEKFINMNHVFSVESSTQGGSCLTVIGPDNEQWFFVEETVEEIGEKLNYGI